MMTTNAFRIYKRVSMGDANGREVAATGRLKGWILLSVMLVFIPCVHAEEHPAEHNHDSVPHELKLNSGKKWNADSHTMKYATQMNARMEKFEEHREEKNLSEIQALGKELQKSMDDLIRGCTMTGPSHNQLHIWLSGVTPQIAMLKDAKTFSQANEAFDKLKPQLKEFTEYFSLSNS